MWVEAKVRGFCVEESLRLTGLARLVGHPWLGLGKALAGWAPRT
jgi:hypothetical protein